MELYSLYFDENKMSLEINRKKLWILSKEQEQQILKDTIIKYNTNYFLGINKKALMIKALEIKKEWMNNANLRILKLENLKVKVRK